MVEATAAALAATTSLVTWLPLRGRSPEVLISPRSRTRYIVVKVFERRLYLVGFDDGGKSSDLFAELVAGTERHPVVLNNFRKESCHVWAPHHDERSHSSQLQAETFSDVIGGPVRSPSHRGEILFVMAPVRTEFRLERQKAAGTEEDMVDVSVHEHHMIDDYPSFTLELAELGGRPFLGQDAGMLGGDATRLKHERIDPPCCRRE